MPLEHWLILGFGIAALFGWLFWFSERLDRKQAQENAAHYYAQWLRAEGYGEPAAQPVRVEDK